MNKLIELLKSSKLWTGATSFFLLFFGVNGIILSSLGTCAFCLISTLALFLSVFHLTIGFLLDYNLYFISSGILLLIATIYLANNDKHKCKTKNCPIKKRKSLKHPRN